MEEFSGMSPEFGKVAHGQYCSPVGFPRWTENPARIGTIKSKTRGGPFSYWPRLVEAVGRGEVA